MFGQHRHLSRRVLTEYQDNLLPPGRRQRVQRELAACEVCCEELEGLNAVVSLLRQTPELPVHRSFTFAAPPPAAARPSLVLRLPNWSYAGAASLAALALVVLVSADAAGILAPREQAAGRQTFMASPAPLELAAEGTPNPTEDRVRTTKSADAETASPGTTQLSQPGVTHALGPTPVAGGVDRGPAPPAAPAGPAGPSGPAGPAEPAAPAPVDAEGSTGLTAESRGLNIDISGTPWYWRALEGLAAVAALVFLLGLLLRLRRVRR